jgi:hypothetical protein
MNFSYRPLKATVFATLALGSCALMARADDSAAQVAARKAIVAQYAVMDRSAEKLDVDAFLAVCAPDFESKKKDGTVTRRPEYDEKQKQEWLTPGLHILSSQTKVDKLEWFGEEAIVWSSNVVKMEIGQKSVEAIGSSRELWHPTDGVWLTKRTVEIKTEVKVDGKVVPIP